MLTESHLHVVARLFRAAGPFFGISHLSADPAIRSHSAVGTAKTPNAETTGEPGTAPRELSDVP